ncbi:LysM peptidoglycan-binding domain-containing protein [Sansalvadorimonas sp. 2012CJ34-2]|uniref:LysM peptidoglycan-binding domain-containing protein n=1 Tax=Parendozoicomonas callyspongiae TaxID=2942213 RepID=A0ABT0PAY1_9GAMM|nr:LysM domain-containing protein [Sansalvadorimonas sp. 2012CJ34-2]MCL6268535.1 LysM peptidoglycan-binding domain-containing protein [Sansalvadorimonas sp. 2012CJ34-2]
MKNALLGFILLCVATSSLGESLFRDDRPASYTAVEGDTLWGIAGRFLHDPWSWGQVWEVDPSVKDPDLIYPGDTIRVIKIGSELKLTLTRKKEETVIPGRTIKLTPQVRSTPLVDAIPAIPLDAIHSFLGVSRVMDSQDAIEKAPRVLANGQERVISGAGDTLYARGDFSRGDRKYGAFRSGETYKDPKTGEELGILMQHVGSLTMKGLQNDVATMFVTKATKEVRVNDRLLVSEERRLATSFSPDTPDNPYVEGVIIDVVGGIHNIGIFNNVVVNLGSKDRMKDGDVLAIYRSRNSKDKRSGQTLKLPAQRVGLVMIYRTYSKVSFAVVMQATQPLATGDVLKAP